MDLTFAEDFSSGTQLDSQLIGTPDSGLWWNRGVHPICTIDNLLSFLPIVTITPDDYVAETTYGIFETSRKLSDVVTSGGLIYLSLTAANKGNTPVSSPTNWQLTNIESLRVRSFLWSVEDNWLSALKLNRKLIENQYIYNVGTNDQTLPNDYAGWVFEPKGSDYVRIRINQIALQANTATPQSMYVINQEQLVTTLTLNQNADGRLEFEDVGYSFSGKGRFYFVIDSQSVKSDNVYSDPLRYDGFVCYPINGIGASAAAAEYSETSNSNGINFNISCYLESSQYVTNNKIDFAKFLQSQFEYDFVRMILHNANNRSNMEERIQKSGLNTQILALEALDLEKGTVAKNYFMQRAIAIKSVNKTFDKFLHTNEGLRVRKGVA